MFYNRIQPFFIPSANAQPFSLEFGYFLADSTQTSIVPHQVQIADIYEAARRRALMEHELDKLFNPDFYDYQI